MATKSADAAGGELTDGIFSEDGLGWRTRVSSSNLILCADSEFVLAASQQLRHPVLHLRMDPLRVAAYPPKHNGSSVSMAPFHLNLQHHCQILWGLCGAASLQCSDFKHSMALQVGGFTDFKFHDSGLGKVKNKYFNSITS